MTQYTGISVAIDRLELIVASPTMQGNPGMLGRVQSFEVGETSAFLVAFHSVGILELASLVSPGVSCGEYRQIWRGLDDTEWNKCAKARI